ncbi:prepilin peptidase [Sesbania bispinosa]|nr:prepilin peptidase [Sesbania bispinosa]
MSLPSPSRAHDGRFLVLSRAVFSVGGCNLAAFSLQRPVPSSMVSCCCAMLALHPLMPPHMSQSPFTSKRHRSVGSSSLCRDWRASEP